MVLLIYWSVAGLSYLIFIPIFLVFFNSHVLFMGLFSCFYLGLMFYLHSIHSFCGCNFPGSSRSALGSGFLHLMYYFHMTTSRS